MSQLKFVRSRSTEKVTPLGRTVKKLERVPSRGRPTQGVLQSRVPSVQRSIMQLLDQQLNKNSQFATPLQQNTPKRVALDHDTPLNEYLRFVTKSAQVTMPVLSTAVTPLVSPRDSKCIESPFHPLCMRGVHQQIDQSGSRFIDCVDSQQMNVNVPQPMVDDISGIDNISSCDMHFIEDTQPIDTSVDEQKQIITSNPPNYERISQLPPLPTTLPQLPLDIPPTSCDSSYEEIEIYVEMATPKYLNLTNLANLTNFRKQPNLATVVEVDDITDECQLPKNTEQSIVISTPLQFKKQDIEIQTSFNHTNPLNDRTNIYNNHKEDIIAANLHSIYNTSKDIKADAQSQTKTKKSLGFYSYQLSFYSPQSKTTPKQTDVDLLSLDSTPWGQHIPSNYSIPHQNQNDSKTLSRSYLFSQQSELLRSKEQLLDPPGDNSSYLHTLDEKFGDYEGMDLITNRKDMHRTPHDSRKPSKKSSLRSSKASQENNQYHDHLKILLNQSNNKPQNKKTLDPYFEFKRTLKKNLGPTINYRY